MLGKKLKMSLYINYTIFVPTYIFCDFLVGVLHCIGGGGGGARNLVGKINDSSNPIGGHCISEQIWTIVFFNRGRIKHQLYRYNF